MNMNHDPFWDWGGHPILGDAQVGSSVSSGQFGQHKSVSLNALLH